MRAASLTPKTELSKKYCFRVLVFGDFDDEQLLNLPTMIEFHGSHAKVEIFVEEGVDQQQFSRLMASVRKAAPEILFEIKFKVPLDTLQEIEQEHKAEGGTVFEEVV